jgi:HEAT repeat protein
MEILSEDVGHAKEVVDGILKAKKLLKMYPSNNPIYAKTSEEVYNKFKNLFNFTNELSLKIHQNKIIFNKEQIYHNPSKDDNLAFFFFKDGIRDITFSSGLSREEFEDFISILNTDFEKVALDDDIVTLLWERDFEHIKYIVDDEILYGKEELDRDGQKIIEEIKKESCSDDNLTKAYHEGLKAAEGHIGALIPVSESDFKHVADDIAKDEAQPRIDKILIILYELTYQIKENTIFSEIVGFIENSIDYCIKGGDFKRASAIVDSIKSIIKDAGIGEGNIKVLKRIFTMINSEPLVQEIGKIIDSRALAEENYFIFFIKHLDKTSIPSLIRLMGELRSIKGRRLVIDALSIIGKQDVKTLAIGLNDSRWYVVRNIISILGKISDTRSMEFLIKILSHPDPRARKEAVKTLGNTESLKILPYFKKTLNDNDSSVRTTTARTLGNTKTETAKRVLLTELSRKDFLSRDFTEKKDFYESITHWKDQEVRNFLLAVLMKKKFFRKTKNDETRACAAHALGIVGDKEVVPFLEKTKKTKNNLLKKSVITAIKRLTS